jgi:hypothetical protein
MEVRAADVSTLKVDGVPKRFEELADLEARSRRPFKS